MARGQGFRQELERLINKHSREYGSDTADFILADYLIACLKAFDVAVRARDRWYGRKSGPQEVRSELQSGEPGK